MAKKQLMIDRAFERIENVHNFTGLLLKYKRELQEPELEEILVTGDRVPFDLLAFIFETVVRPEMANILTPVFQGNWRIVAEQEGVVLPDEE